MVAKAAKVGAALGAGFGGLFYLAGVLYAVSKHGVFDEAVAGETLGLSLGFLLPTLAASAIFGALIGALVGLVVMVVNGR